MANDEKNIKFPDQHFITFQQRKEDEIPLGFMVPDGEDTAARKRKQTAIDWASPRWRGSVLIRSLPNATYENKSMSGFKLGRNIRHNSSGWGQGNVKWRIEDPRGFELEITSPNLAKIILHSTIENGEIIDACMWARCGAENVLVPVSTDIYKNAVLNTERSKKKASIKDAKLGDRLVLLNGIEGRYLGVHYPVLHQVYQADRQFTEIQDKKYFLMLYEEDGKYCTYAAAAFKVAELHSGEEISETEAERLANEGRTDFAGTGNHRHVGWVKSRSVRGYIKKSGEDAILPYKLEEINRANALLLDGKNPPYYPTGTCNLVLKNSMGLFGLASRYLHPPIREDYGKDRVLYPMNNDIWKADGYLAFEIEEYRDRRYAMLFMDGEGNRKSIPYVATNEDELFLIKGDMITSLGNKITFEIA